MCRFRTPGDWMRFREDFEEDDLMWFEQQAYEFAGRLLVPREALICEVQRLAAKILDYKKRGGNDEEQIVQAVARSVCRTFAVSADVIARRIKSERLVL
jgi:Zn-dependent peptidase ImmA (M78 family)